MFAIYKKEMRSYFNTMIGFIFIAIFFVIVGIYFAVTNLVNGSAKFEYVLSSISFLYIILAPILTMRLLAEEKKQKTDQLLLTAPVSVEKIVIGKYMASFSMLFIPMIVISFYPLILNLYGEVQLSVAYSSIIGFTLLGAAYLALGLFISSITESQVIALIVTALIILISNLAPGISSYIPSDNKTAWIVLAGIMLVICIIAYFAMENTTISISIGIIGEAALAIVYFVKPALYDGIISKLFTGISINAKFENFQYGILDLNSIVYFLSLIFLFVVLTIQMIKKRRWS